jgi:hypothetical protein
MTLQLQNDIGHWTHSSKFNPDKWFGFVYCIENLVTQQYYIGKKQLWHGGKKKSKTYGKPMSWKTYVGSSTSLKKDIQKYGKDQFNFEIVDLYRTKGGLYYSEAYLQMLCDCMTEYLKDGKTPRFYNRQIAAIRFVPSESPSKKTKSYINKLRRKYS